MSHSLARVGAMGCSDVIHSSVRMFAVHSETTETPIPIRTIRHQLSRAAILWQFLAELEFAPGHRQAIMHSHCRRELC